MATANPTQFYEKVSEVEALSRYDHLNGQNLYEVPQEALNRNARQYRCEQRCQWSTYQQRNICDWWCPRY